MRRRLRTALSFSPGDWLLLARSWLLVLRVDFKLRCEPFASVQAWARQRPERAQPPDPDVAQAHIQRARRMVDVARSYHLYPMTCLRRSLALQRLLARQGIQTDLRIGAQRQGGEMRAHAWLEYQGVPIGEPQEIERRFIPLVSIKSNS